LSLGYSSSQRNSPCLMCFCSGTTAAASHGRYATALAAVCLSTLHLQEHVLHEPTVAV
jgi:hypothetical protein